MIKLFVGSVAACAYAASSPLRFASGILFWLLSVASSIFPHRTLRSPTELKDGHDYLFDHGKGHRVRRTFFSDPLRAARHERGAFILVQYRGTDSAQCWQKQYPDGSPCGAGTGCWVNLDMYFDRGRKRTSEEARIRRAGRCST